MPLSQTPGAIAARARRATAAASRTNVELTRSTRAVETARTALEEAQRPRVYTTPPSTNPSAIRARASRLAARIDLATYALSQAEARLARATNPPAPRPARPARAPRRAAQDPAARHNRILEESIEKIFVMAETLVQDGSGLVELQIEVTRETRSARGTWSSPYTQIIPRTAVSLYDRTEDLKNTIFYEREDLRIVQIKVVPGQRIAGVRRFQTYLDGPEHCVLRPIIDALSRRIETSTSEKRVAELRALIKKATKLTTTTYANGVPEDKMQDLSNYLRVKVLIRTPCAPESVTQVYSPRGAPVLSVTYIHTRLDHLTQVTIGDKIHVSREKLKEIFKELQHQTNVYYEYQRFMDGPVWVRTVDGTYCIDQMHNDFVRECGQEWGLSRLCGIKNAELSLYLTHASTHPGHFDVRDISEFALTMPCGYKLPGCDDYACIDMKAAYTQGATCDQYVGYPARITDFRKTTKQMGLGFYTVHNVKLSPPIQALDTLTNGLFADGAVLTSASLKFLDDYACTYEISAGAWGTRTDIDFSDPRWFEKEEGVPLYSRTVGTWMIQREADTFWVAGSKEFLSHVAAMNKDSDIVRVFPEWGELSVTRKAESAYHLKHVAAYVTDYVILAMLKQALAMDQSQILRFGCDCIYTTQKDAPLTGAFRVKDGELMKTNIAGQSYINRSTWAPVPEAEFRDMKMVELHNGPAGCGKTHSMLVDKGLINPIYVAPSHVLASAVRVKFGVKSIVWDNALTNTPTWHEYQRCANNLIIDEASMLTEPRQRAFIERFGGSARTIFCGDMCQLGAYSEGEVQAIPFNPALCNKVVEHTENYRCKCDLLAGVLGRMRKNIESNARCSSLAIGSFQHISVDSLVEKYDPLLDTILTHSNDSKDAYTGMLDAHGKPKKYRVNRRVGTYFNGSIVFERAAPLTEESSDMQHAFTVHSVQGLTVKRQENGGRLFIDRSTLRDARLIYTAASRVEYLDQIYLIDDETIEDNAPANEVFRCTETASVDVARWLMDKSDEEIDELLKKHLDGEYEKEVREFGKTYADGRREKNKLFKRQSTVAYADRVIRGNGIVKVSYAHSRENQHAGKKCGRLYAMRGMQSLPGSVRGLFMRDTEHRDLDIRNCHPSLALWVARHHGLQVPCLERYITERDAVFAETGMTKLDPIIMLNREARTRSDVQFVKDLDSEFKLLQDTVWSSQEYNYIRSKCLKVQNEHNLKGSYLNQHLCHLENSVLMRVASKLNRVHSLYFDGLITADPVTIEQLNSWTTDYGLTWSVKPHCPRLQMTPTQ